MRSVSVTMSPRRRTAFLAVLAVLAPLVIAVVFPHPTAQLVLPVALMLSVVVLLTWFGGFAVGAIATISSVAAAWYFNTPPGETFGIDSFDDAAALVVVLTLALGTALLLELLRARDRRA